MQSSASDPLPDDALVVRGGQNTPDLVRKGPGTHRSGVTGVSVHSSPRASVAELAVGIPNGQIGVTTVGRVRAEGGDVIRTSGRSPYHATLTGLTPEQISSLLTPTEPNPAPGTG
jgi:hypothetical protein